MELSITVDFRCQAILARRIKVHADGFISWCSGSTGRKFADAASADRITRQDKSSPVNEKV
jgi:hypothetical protein